MIKEISLDEFGRLFPDFPTAFDTVSFNRLNADKAERIAALCLFDENDKPLAGQIFGIKDNIYKAPFSAPYSVPALNSDIPTNTFYDQVAAYVQKPIKLVWTPECYSMPSPPSGSEQITDYNYHYPLERFADYEKYLSRSGRYNHNRAAKHNFNFYHTDDVEHAYAIIAENRRLMGYPLAMSLKQVQDTIKIIPADFFILTLDGLDAAAAMLYQVTPYIMQNIYWGDLPSSRSARAMNHLAWEIFKWYSENRPQIKIIDIGPASTDGILNEGLAQFKLSIGCIETKKPTIIINKH